MITTHLLVTDTQELRFVIKPLPEKPECNPAQYDEMGAIDAGQCRESVDCPCHHYESTLMECSVRAEDQEKAEYLIQGYSFDKDSGYWFNRDHTDMKSHPPELKFGLYPIEVGVEIMEQWALKGTHEWYDEEDERFDLHHPDDTDYRQVAVIVD